MICSNGNFWAECFVLFQFYKNDHPNDSFLTPAPMQNRNGVFSQRESHFSNYSMANDRTWCFKWNLKFMVDVTVASRLFDSISVHETISRVEHNTEQTIMCDVSSSLEEDTVGDKIYTFQLHPGLVLRGFRKGGPMAMGVPLLLRPPPSVTTLPR